MIYFITARDVRRVKVGWSIDPAKRLKELQTGCPAKCAIEATIDTDQSFEKEIHYIYRKWRTHGEWFELSPALESAILIANGASLEDAQSSLFNQLIAERRGVAA